MMYERDNRNSLMLAIPLIFIGMFAIGTIFGYNFKLQSETTQPKTQIHAYEKQSQPADKHYNIKSDQTLTSIQQ